MSVFDTRFYPKLHTVNLSWQQGFRAYQTITVTCYQLSYKIKYNKPFGVLGLGVLTLWMRLAITTRSSRNFLVYVVCGQQGHILNIWRAYWAKSLHAFGWFCLFYIHCDCDFGSDLNPHSEDAFSVMTRLRTL